MNIQNEIAIIEDKILGYEKQIELSRIFDSKRIVAGWEFIKNEKSKVKVYITEILNELTKINNECGDLFDNLDTVDITSETANHVSLLRTRANVILKTINAIVNGVINELIEKTGF